jgi:RNA polymerase sigma factor (sigma-70 family)
VTEDPKTKEIAVWTNAPRRPLDSFSAGGDTAAMSSPTPESTDEQLARSARHRDPEVLELAQDACRELYRRYARPLLAFLAARLPYSDLEDAHHEVWVRVWQHLPDRFDGSHFRGWLYTIARNHLADRARAHRLTADLPDDRPDAHQGCPDEELMEQERRRILENCLKKLDAVQAQLVRGRLGGEDYPDLCARLGLVPARAHKLFHAAKAQLQDCVGRTDA